MREFPAEVIRRTECLVFDHSLELANSSEEQVLGGVDVDIEVVFAETDLKDCIVEEIQSKEFVLHDLGVAQEGEVLNPLPVPDEAVVAAEVGLQHSHEESGWVDQVQVKLAERIFSFFLFGLKDLDLLDLG